MHNGGCAGVKVVHALHTYHNGGGGERGGKKAIFAVFNPGMKLHEVMEEGSACQKG